MATPEVLYDGKVYSQDRILINDLEYQIAVSDDGGSAMVKTDYKFTILKPGKCDIYSEVKICIDYIGYDKSVLNNYAFVTVFAHEPEIKVNRTLESDYLYVGNDLNLDIEIKNQGETLVKDLKFVDDYPESMKVSKVSKPCTLQENTIYYYGDIEDDNSITCRADVIFKQPVTQSLVGTITYDSKNETVNEFTAPLDIDVGFDIDFKLSDLDELKIGEYFNLTLDFENHKLKDYPVKLTVIFPDEIYEKKYSQGNNIYEVERKVYTNESINSENKSNSITFQIKSDYDGIFDIDFILEYDGYVNSKAKRIYTKDNGLNITHNIESLESGVQKRFVIEIGNNNAKLDIINVKTKLETDGFFFVPERTTDLIEAGETKTVLTHSVIIPNIKTKARKKFLITIEYETTAGQKFTEEKEFFIWAEPPRSIEIIHRFSENIEESEEGDAITLSVSIKNMKEAYLRNVHITDISEFVKTGTFDIYKNLEGFSEVEVYEYTFFLPSVKDKQSVPINTSVTYILNEDLYTYDKSSIVTINNKNISKKVSLKVDRSFDIENDPYVYDIIPVIYIIENNGEVPIFNLNITEVYMPDMDIVGNSTFTIKKLDPNEKIRLTDSFKIRIKSKNLKELNTTQYTYSDEFLDEYTVKSSRVGIGPKARDDIFEPLIFVNLTAPVKSSSNTTFNISLILENKGLKSSDLILRFLGEDKNMSISANTSMVIDYFYTTNITGIKKVDPAIVYYTVNEHSLSTSSNKLYLELIKLEVVEPVVLNETEEYESDIEYAKETGFIMKLWNGFRRLIGK